ncbi:MAG: zinc/manganese transport system permease protein [Acidimicrobiaceae bacterium]|jgi:zinc/manganese transport system permease protein
MVLADSTHLSWNVIDDVRQMFAFPFMVNAFRAGTIVAILAAVIGWFMVLRRQTFAGHTLALVGFPGAAGASLVGVSAQFGYFGFCTIAAVAIGALPSVASRSYGDESAFIGTLQAFALACGFLFVSLYGGNLTGVTSLLFGTFFGITNSQVLVLLAVAVMAIALVGLGARPLLFASIDPDVAAARGLPTRWLSVGFLVLLGVAAAEVSQVTGSLLVFALLVLPPATAQRLSARPGVSLLAGVVLALLVTWIGLSAAFFSPYPSGFWITTLAFGGYVSTLLISRRR